MNEKKEKIIKTSIHLFAKKGFASTTIQEIASECGISKGAFYLHFKSKEALLLSACEYYIGMSMKKMKNIEEDLAEKPPKEVLKKQIGAQFEDFRDHKDFIVLLLTENIIPENQQIKQYFYKVTAETDKLYRSALLASYGKGIERYIADLSIMARGIVHSYMNVMVFNGELSIDAEEISAFLIERLDDLVQGLIHSTLNPIVPKDIFRLMPAGKEQLLEDIRKVKENSTLPEDIAVSLDVIAEELSQDKPRKPIMKGMLSNLTGTTDKEVEKLRALISVFISI
ncbi:TetR family transcriptional regulator [Bacillus vallismortis]|nr:TetR family transcriptional regulator [Bacillus vallismortis]QAV09771.1 TetR/AcrR family transcriptional regulator [Bacillus vallismortis]